MSCFKIMPKWVKDHRGLHSIIDYIALFTVEQNCFLPRLATNKFFWSLPDYGILEEGRNDGTAHAPAEGGL